MLGPEVEGFEQEFASYCEIAHCISVANGTDALELALRALGVGSGKCVATVANAGMYSTIATLLLGATPVYIDVRPDNLLMDAGDLAHQFNNQRIDAVIVTHLYGLMADVPALIELARINGVPVIEDCAQAHGAVLNGKKAGTFGDIGCFSFYPTKNLGAIGDGGAVITARADLAEKVKSLRQYGWTAKYCSTLPGGRNSRLDELQAAVLRAKLPRLDTWNTCRRAIAARYTQGIRHPAILCPPAYGGEYVAHLYVIRTRKRDALKAHLCAAGISSDVHYPFADYQQVSCREQFTGLSKAVTEQACEGVLTLPCFPEMTDAEVDWVIDCINQW